MRDLHFLDAHHRLALGTALALGTFLLLGYIKGGFTGTNRVRSAAQTTLIGGVAAGVAFAIARIVA